MNIKERIEQYYKDNKELLCKKILKRVFEPQDIEDIVHEAFTKALRSASAFKEDGNFNAWFGIILDNCVKDYRTEFLYNKIGMATTDITELEEEEHPADTTNIDMDWALVRQIAQSIGVMAPSQQEVLRLYYTYGYKPQEIRFLVRGIGPAGIKSLIHRFKEEVRNKYDNVQ